MKHGVGGGGEFEGAWHAAYDEVLLLDAVLAQGVDSPLQESVGHVGVPFGGDDAYLVLASVGNGGGVVV